MALKRFRATKLQKGSNLPPVNKQIEGKHTKKKNYETLQIVWYMYFFFYFDVPLKSGDRWKFCLQTYSERICIYSVGIFCYM